MWLTVEELLRSCSSVWLPFLRLQSLSYFGSCSFKLVWVNRSLQFIRSTLSITGSIPFGVPQASILVCILFISSWAEFSRIIKRCELELHQYADSCQLHIDALTTDSAAAATSLRTFSLTLMLDDVRLCVEPSKTQIMWLGSRQQLKRTNIDNAVFVNRHWHCCWCTQCGCWWCLPRFLVRKSGSINCSNYAFLHICLQLM